MEDNLKDLSSEEEKPEEEKVDEEKKAEEVGEVGEADKENNDSKNKKAETELDLLLAQKKMRFWLIVSALCLVASLFLVLAVYFTIAYGKKEVQNKLLEDNSFALDAVELKDDIKKDFIPRRLDGVRVPPGEDDLRPLAVMIDNHPDARPAFGIEKAQLVIEAEAEGGITRFLAFFSTAEEIEKIGPVRSARPYFVDWAKEVSALYVHVGGSPEALAKMSKEKTLHINEFYNENYFWRGKDYFAPHNVFSSSDKLREYLQVKEIGYSNFIAWNFADEKKASSSDAEIVNPEIKIDFLLPGFDVSWLYESDSNSYLRRVGGEPQLSANGENIFAKNIVIQYVDSEVIDDEKRQEFSHIGEGESLVCLDGVCNEGTWKKRDTNFRTKFYTENDEEFVFNPGTTWIEAVNPNYSVEY